MTSHLLTDATRGKSKLEKAEILVTCLCQLKIIYFHDQIILQSVNSFVVHKGPSETQMEKCNAASRDFRGDVKALPQAQPQQSEFVLFREKAGLCWDPFITINNTAKLPAQMRRNVDAWLMNCLSQQTSQQKLSHFVSLCYIRRFLREMSCSACVDPSV